MRGNQKFQSARTQREEFSECHPRDKKLNTDEALSRVCYKSTGARVTRRIKKNIFHHLLSAAAPLCEHTKKHKKLRLTNRFHTSLLLFCITCEGLRRGGRRWGIRGREASLDLADRHFVLGGGGEEREPPWHRAENVCRWHWTGQKHIYFKNKKKLISNSKRRSSNT